MCMKIMHDEKKDEYKELNQVKIIKSILNKNPNPH